MLVLTRKSNQSIMIGDEIEVSVLAIMGEKVRIGIEAPRSIPVFRKEVYLEIREDSSHEETRQQVNEALEQLKSPPAGWAGGGPEGSGAIESRRHRDPDRHQRRHRAGHDQRRGPVLAPRQPRPD